MRHRTLLVVGVPAVVVIALLAAALLWLGPMGPGPALPAGATRLHLATEAAHVVPNLGCPVALLAPARITTSGDELVLVTVPTGDPDPVVWPSGWAAWRIDGRAVLVRRDGSVVGREGDVVDGFGGGVGTDDSFHVCVIGD